jgi:hypothetical protein
MQPYVLKECQRAREHPWIFSKLDLCVEVPYNEKAGDSYRPHSASALPLLQS